MLQKSSERLAAGASVSQEAVEEAAFVLSQRAEEIAAEVTPLPPLLDLNALLQQAKMYRRRRSTRRRKRKPKNRWAKAFRKLNKK